MSGYFTKQYYHRHHKSDEEFEEFLKKHKGQYSEEDLAFRYRFLNKAYTDRLYQNKNRKFTQEVVIKIITKGSGKKHLNILLRYIERDLHHQEEQDKITLINQDGETISKEDKQNIIDAWSRGFASNDFEISDKDKDALDQYSHIAAHLDQKFFENDLSDDEKRMFFYTDDFKRKKRIDSRFHKGAFIYDKDQGQYGFVERNLDDSFTGYFFDPDMKMSSRTVDLDMIEHAGHRIKKSYHKMPKDFSHFIFSPGGDEPDKENTRIATLNMLNGYFSHHGYEFLVGEHQDTHNLHYHVVVKHRSLYEGQEPLHLNKFDLHAMRLAYSEELDHFGVSREATYKMDRGDYLQSLRQKGGVRRRKGFMGASFRRWR